MTTKKTYDFVSLFSEYANFSKQYMEKTFAKKTDTVDNVYTKAEIDSIVNNVATNEDINLIFK